MTPKGEGLAERAAKGNYTLIAPLDYLIMEALPEEGTLFAGLYPLGETVRNLGVKLPKTPDKKNLPSSMIQTRLRLLSLQGLASKAQRNLGTSGAAVWQRTKTGTEVLKAWKGGQNGSTKSGS